MKKEVTMGKAVKLTMSRAKELIKRELGISTIRLEAPPSMNQNHKYPWYELRTGNLLITLYTNDFTEGKMIVLILAFNDGLGSLSRYFYSDTLEEAPDYTEGCRWEEISDLVEGTDIAAKERSLHRRAREACLAHYNRIEVNTCPTTDT